jgi:hypothetical protein
MKECIHDDMFIIFLSDGVDTLTFYFINTYKQ